MTQGVIEFDAVTKRYGANDKPAVNELSLRIEAGEICALVGPSGSGKTTALRMINRLIEPTSGSVRIDGVDNRSLPLEDLRRSIGYVIQAGGLFPHRTILDNVATVPRLLNWPENITATRSRELLELVGLPAAEFGMRFPGQLSGGQRQRVGVARALAADPPVMLMDEPFGAIDPVVRGRIQGEFLDLQRKVGKTIVIVTHDIDEAIKMGDSIALLREGGILAQHGSPDELLGSPRDAFVAEFFDHHTALQRLSLRTVETAQLVSLADAARQGFALQLDAAGRALQWSNGQPATPAIHRAASLRDALAQMIAVGAYVAPVVDDDGRPLAVITLDAIQASLREQAQQEAAAPAASHPPNTPPYNGVGGVRAAS